MNKALVRGILEAGFVEERDFRIEERFAHGQFDRVPAIAAELIRVPVSVSGERAPRRANRT